MKVLFSNHWGVVGSVPELLNYTNSWIGDAYTEGVKELVKIGKSYNISCEPFTLEQYAEADAFCIWEAPRVANNERENHSYQMIMRSGKPIYAVFTEPFPVDSENYLATNAIFYDKIFTWDTSLIDNYKYVAIRPMWFSFDRPSNYKRRFDDRRLCCMIGHILSDIFSPSATLYNKRAEILEWFERNHPDDIDLYGKQPYGVGRLQKYTFFKGKSENKRETLSNYKFQFCYENSRYNDYVTEKLFDCFLSGCVPIYIGAPNVTDYIPKNAFIDPNEYDSLDDLYNYLTNISESEYNKYLAAADLFLGTPFAQSYKPNVFAETVIQVLKGDKNGE